MKTNTRIFAGLLILFSVIGAACTANDTQFTANPNSETLPPQPGRTILQSPQPIITDTIFTTATEPPETAFVPTVTVPSTPPAPTQTPVPTLSWDEVVFHIGENQTVCGPVVGAAYASSSEGQPTFLNIGENFPDETRFSVVIWDDARDNFPVPPETAFLGKTVCVNGEISQFEGVVQMTVEYPAQISLP